MSCSAISSAPMPRANVPAAIDWPALRSMPAPTTAWGPRSRAGETHPRAWPSGPSEEPPRLDGLTGPGQPDRPEQRKGGTGAGQGNLISGNVFQGLRMSGAASTGNRVVANRIGTNRSGDAALANGSKVEDGDGIRIEGGRFNVIGGSTAAERNILSGNHDDGIDVRDGASDNTEIGR